MVVKYSVSIGFKIIMCMHTNHLLILSQLKIYQENGMKECLTTPQHEKQIGYWVSDIKKTEGIINRALVFKLVQWF